MQYIFWELVLKFKELFKSDVGWTYLSFFSTYQIIGPICLRAWVCKSLQNSGNATKQGIFQISSHLLCGEIWNSLTCWGMWWYLATFLIFMHPQYFQAFQLCTEWLLFPLAYIGEQLQQLWDEYTSVPCEEWGGVFWWTGSIRIELNLQSCYQIRNTVRTTSKCLRDTFKRSSISPCIILIHRRWNSTASVRQMQQLFCFF